MAKNSSKGKQVNNGVRRLTSSPEKLSRSEQMARIKSSGNKTTEIRLIELFRANGITGWRRRSSIYGKPDFVFRKQRIAVFVDGCFWHGHPTRCRLPANNRTYWVNKIRINRKRDRQVNAFLRDKGWVVFRIWEHELKRASEARLLARLLRCFDEAIVGDRLKASPSKTGLPRRSLFA